MKSIETIHVIHQRKLCFHSTSATVADKNERRKVNLNWFPIRTLTASTLDKMIQPLVQASLLCWILEPVLLYTFGNKQITNGIFCSNSTRIWWKNNRVEKHLRFQHPKIMEQEELCYMSIALCRVNNYCSTFNNLIKLWTQCARFAFEPNAGKFARNLIIILTKI